MRTLPTPPGEAEHAAPPARAPGIGLRHALAGLAFAYRSQRNLRIQAALGLCAGITASLLPLGPMALAFLVLVIGAVLAAELLNTALEAAVDLASPTLHPLAKTAKDVAAGAVLLLSLAALAIGALLFLPPLLRFEFRPERWPWALGLLVLGLSLHLGLRRFPLAFDSPRD